MNISPPTLIVLIVCSMAVAVWWYAEVLKR